MRAIIVCLLACLVAASEAKADCSAADAKVAKLTAEVESLRQQLADAQSQSGSCPSQEFSVVDAVSKGFRIGGDVVQHLLDQTTVDEKVVDAVSGHVEAAKTFGGKVVDQIASHPCSSDYNECVKTVTSSPVYKTHLAAHVDTVMTAAKPHLDAAQPHVDTALEKARTAYASSVETATLVRQKSSDALEQASTIASKSPEYLHNVLDPAFSTLKKASPKHHHVLPKKPLDRLLLLCCIVVFIYSFWFVPRIGLMLVRFALSLAIALGIKVPLKVTKAVASWSFFFGTGFYVCGLCRRRKAAEEKKDKKSADAKSEPKKNGASNGASKPATEKEIVDLLEKTKQKGKLNDGVTRMVTAAKSGKALQAPDDMKGKEVKKDVLKKALAKFKEVDIKKLGL